ncbi:MAG: 16S rRNA processing protein RimM [Bacteroidetes bacterium]|nr:16S rRNA processing protein RimM [Bacteroidota bacterium]
MYGIPDLVKIGYIQKIHGFKGQMKVYLDYLSKQQKKHLNFIWIFQYGKPVPYKLELWKEIEERSILIELSDIRSDQEALPLRNLEIYCEEALFEQYFEEEESYDYLINMLVKDEYLGEIGPIIEVVENENSHANLMVNYQGKEVLIPFVDEMILDINEKKGIVHTNLPDGLLEL